MRVCANPPFVGESKQQQQQNNGSNVNSAHIIDSSNYIILQKTNFIIITNDCVDDFVYDLVFIINSYGFRVAFLEQDKFVFVIFLHWFILEFIINILNIVEKNEQEKTKKKTKTKKRNKNKFLCISNYFYVCMYVLCDLFCYILRY